MKHINNTKMSSDWRTKAKEYKKTDDYKKGKGFKNRKR